MLLVDPSTFPFHMLHVIAKFNLKKCYIIITTGGGETQMAQFYINSFEWSLLVKW